MLSPRVPACAGGTSEPEPHCLMKRCLACLLLAATTALAAAPAFSPAPLTLVFTPDATHLYRADPEATRDGQLVYAVTGQVFGPDAGAVAPAVGATTRSSPWLTLAELLKAYAAGDLAAIRTLYTAGSASFFERLEAKPELRERWLASTAKVTGAKVLLAYRDGPRVIAFVKLEGGAEACPFIFEEVDGRYLLSAGPAGSGGLFWNLGLALANFRLKPEDLVRR